VVHGDIDDVVVHLRDYPHVGQRNPVFAQIHGHACRVGDRRHRVVVLPDRVVGRGGGLPRVGDRAQLRILLAAHHERVNRHAAAF
jgi:hypothetical protein